VGGVTRGGGGVGGVGNLDVNRTGKACFDFRSIHHLKKEKRGKEAENQSLLVTMQGMLRMLIFFCSFDAGVPGRIVSVLKDVTFSRGI
jgi:hypothetical protein